MISNICRGMYVCSIGLVHIIPRDFPGKIRGQEQAGLQTGKILTLITSQHEFLLQSSLFSFHNEYLWK